MRIVVCPGMHAPKLTESFLEAMAKQTGAAIWHEALVVPTHIYPAYSGIHILKFLHERLSANCSNDCSNIPLILIGFSAGVVGAIAAALAWQQSGRQIRALIAIDGWGVPLAGNFPIHRLSHDNFTHWSSALLGQGGDSFYAEPSVAHLDMWRSPDSVMGWHLSTTSSHLKTAITAARFLGELLDRYSEQSFVGR